MSAGMAVAAHDCAARQAQAKLRPDNVNDALPGLVDIEKLDTACRCLDPQARQ